MRLLISAGGGYSHIAPLLPLAIAAREAGHDVVFVTGPGAVGHAEAAGLPTVAVGPAPTGSFDREKYLKRTAGLSPEQRLAYVVGVMAELGAGERIDDMLAFFRRWRPELVLAGTAEFAAVTAAAVLGVPYAVHAISPPKSAAVMAGGWRGVAEIARRHGLDRFPGHDSVPYLDIWPESLPPAGIEWDHPLRWPVRPEGILPAPGEPATGLKGLPHPKSVYVTAGTSHNTRPGLLEAMIAGVRGERVNAVVTIGRDGDRERFGPQPDSVRLEHYVPQSRILPSVDAVVCHAGAGTVLGALAHGLPLVLTPAATDQFDIADQVVRARAGVRAESTAEGIRDALRTVLADPSYRDSAAALAREIATMPPPSAALGRLETLTMKTKA
ncbi:glycosyltransferase family 1 protein [Amycolatopsis rhizosphaerae]|uniref:Glycosyltransferase family 1 protein n=1 Tax=Amycolatopsis rhizosphaerae TaxID=2053003 RepID=A0A558C578_9PSEU|nr:glycosyltransferase [Amycolatopsis rhizosphaerae]TVT43934.1 glycosyltransferase family 1 protein [Amycolatopsis rhizosphaerae]